MSHRACLPARRRNFVVTVDLAPKAELVKHRHERHAALGQAVLHFRRYLGVLDALDDAVGDQTSQRGGERLVSGGRELALQLVVARRAVQVQAEQNWQLALALYQGECLRETSVLDAVAREHDPLFCPCHGSFLYALH